MAISTWLGSVAPEWQAEPPETAMPFRSSAITSASPSRLSNQMLVVLAARGAGLPSGNAPLSPVPGRARIPASSLSRSAGQARHGAVFDAVHGEFDGLRKANDSGDIFGSGATAALVASAHNQRLHRRSTAHEHRAYALGSMHLMAADREQMAAEPAHIKLDLSSALNGVNVEENARICRNFADFCHRLQHAGLVIGQHYADQPRFRADGAQNIVRIDQPAGLWSDEGRLDPEVRQLLCGLEDSRVLDGRRDEVIAGMQQSEERGVVALGAAGVEDDLGIVAIEELGQGLAGTVERRTCLLAIEMDRRGVAKLLNPIGAHRVDHLRQQGSGGVGIHVDPGARCVSCRHEQKPLFARLSQG